MVERLAAQLHYNSLNPVAALGHEFRKTAWPKKPSRPPRVDGTVVIPGGTSAIPAKKI